MELLDRAGLDLGEVMHMSRSALARVESGTSFAKFDKTFVARSTHSVTRDARLRINGSVITQRSKADDHTSTRPPSERLSYRDKFLVPNAKILGTKSRNCGRDAKYVEGPLALKKTGMTFLQIAYAMIAVSYVVAAVALFLGH